MKAKGTRARRHEGTKGKRQLVPDGWSARTWLERLRYLVGVCDNETRRQDLTRWAERVEKLISEGNA